MKFGSIILSGGSSMRMGRHKALIKINGFTFLETIVNNHHKIGIEEPIVLISDFLEKDVCELGLKNIQLVVCSPPEKTPLESLRRGIARLSTDVDGFIVHPIDFPLPSAVTIKSLMDSFLKSGKQIIKPVYDGKGGHPIILSSKLYKEIMQASEEEGLREVVRRDPERILQVFTEDEGVIKNINTTEDLVRTDTNL
ncbi:nucleotidyltransferase family protein [bacterium]|nr:nucleotidyltransferase family protein [bacterium]